MSRLQRSGVQAGCLVCTLAMLLGANDARAQVGEDGEPIESSDYSVDAAQGPITGSTRVLGLAGAFVAIAEGADGTARNAAAVAVRLPHSRQRWDYGASIDIAFGGWLPDSNFINESDSDEQTDVEQDSLLFGSLAVNVYYQLGGFGWVAEARRQALQRESDMAGLSPASLSANYGVVHASLAYGFNDGQLVLGAGPQITGLSLSGQGNSELLAVAGLGAHAGVLVKPHDTQLRFGVAVKSGVEPAQGGGGPTEVNGETIWRPSGVTLPWEASAGFAYQFGPRPLNPRFESVETRSQPILETLRRNVAEQQLRLAQARAQHARAPTPRTRQTIAELEAQLRSEQTLVEQAETKADVELSREYHQRSRHYLLVSTELAMIGGAGDSVTLNSAVTGVVERAKDTPVFSPRLGLEAEVIEHRLKLRGGSYLEPARSLSSQFRVHGTAGFDLKLFHWDLFGALGEFDGWTLSMAADAAKHYLNTSLSIGFWH